MLDLRQDLATVLAKQLLAIGTEPEEARRLASEALTTITATGHVESGESGRAQRLRAELLALRQDVAVVMARLYLAAGRSESEVESIILSPLKLRRTERATSDDSDD